jgi:hypothetical protein
VTLFQGGDRNVMYRDPVPCRRETSASSLTGYRVAGSTNGSKSVGAVELLTRGDTGQNESCRDKIEHIVRRQLSHSHRQPTTVCATAARRLRNRWPCLYIYDLFPARCPHRHVSPVARSNGQRLFGSGHRVHHRAPTRLSRMPTQTSLYLVGHPLQRPIRVPGWEPVVGPGTPVCKLTCPSFGNPA